MKNIVIKEVTSAKQLSRFIAFPNMLYNGNKFRVPQLYHFEKSTLSPAKNPAHSFCKTKYFLAYKDHRLVGRIAGIIHQRANEVWNQKMTRFGWIDFVDDPDVSSALLKAVEDWGRAEGMTALHGPLGFSDMDLEGMLVDGFDQPGTQAVIYNYPYYPVHLEKLGFVKDVDWVQIELKLPEQVPEKVKRFSALVAERYGLRPLKVKKTKELIPYAKKMFQTLNVAFANLYGFVALTDQQVDYYIKLYFSIVKREYVCFILDKNSDVVGFGISMPSMTKALIKAKGKLFPFGFIPVLKSIYGKNEVVDMYLIGVHPDYQGKGVHSIFFTEMTQAYIDNGIKLAISSPQLEKNSEALKLWKHYDHRVHIRRRCYIKHFEL
jgi:ribosomal protein S18 acetylase RimI-like enzyme